MSETTITKSIRVSPEESQEIRHLSETSAISEAALMKKWVLAGIQAQKLDNAIQAYTQGKTDLRNGAAIAGVSCNCFWHEIQARNIVVLDNDYFLDELAFLAEAFKDEVLAKAVERMLVDSERPLHATTA